MFDIQWIISVKWSNKKALWHASILCGVLFALIIIFAGKNAWAAKQRFVVGFSCETPSEQVTKEATALVHAIGDRLAGGSGSYSGSFRVRFFSKRIL